MTVRGPGSRLSKSTKRAVKNSGLSKKKRIALKAELRSPGISKREERLINRATAGSASIRGGRTAGVYASQQKRSKTRAMGKKRNPVR